MQESELKSLRWEHEVLEQRFAQVSNHSLYSSPTSLSLSLYFSVVMTQVQQERDELYARFTMAIHEVQQKSGLKNLLLEKKLSTLTDTLEKKVT